MQNFFLFGKIKRLLTFPLQTLRAFKTRASPLNAAGYRIKAAHRCFKSLTVVFCGAETHTHKHTLILMHLIYFVTCHLHMPSSSCRRCISWISYSSFNEKNAKLYIENCVFAAALMQDVKLFITVTRLRWIHPICRSVFQCLCILLLFFFSSFSLFHSQTHTHVCMHTPTRSTLQCPLFCHQLTHTRAPDFIFMLVCRCSPSHTKQSHAQQG